MEGTSTLADSLLDDLDDLSDVEETQDESPAHDNSNDSQEALTVAGGSGTSESKRFLDDDSLKKHLAIIHENENSKQTWSKEEQEEEYSLIVQSNKYLSRLSDELDRAHDLLKRAYEPKFPELEELIPDPKQYMQAVRVISNEMDMTNVNEPLNDFLNSNQVITISVAGSTTTGRMLSDAELQTVHEHCLYIENILCVQKELQSFVESRMEGLAPSVSVLIGPSLAAELLGLAGGLAELSKIPACNLQVLGQAKFNRKHGIGSRSPGSLAHAGILATSDWVVQNKHYHLQQQQGLQRKALKALAAKVALAARCDFVNVDMGRSRSSTAGLKFRDELQSKIARWRDPDEAPVQKALPKPDLTTKKRRGGKRMRRMKERFEETALMKQANTRAFSTKAGEYGDDAMGLTLGLLDTSAETSGINGIRKTTEKRKMRFANTKASRKKAAQTAAKSAAVSNGLASSMVFTPVQGMELVNPDANKDRIREANRKWFNDNAGFQSALPKK